MKPLSGANIPHTCFKGHIVFKKPSELRKCAHCEGFSQEEYSAALKKTTPARLLGSRVLIAHAGKLYPVEKADIVNGMLPTADYPRDPWFLYYMTMKVEGHKLYKIGISQKPWERLIELDPKLIYFEYYATQAEAYAREQRMLATHSAWKFNIRVPKLRRKGASEFFSKDVLGFDS